MFEERASPISFARLIACGGFGGAIRCVEAAASDDILGGKFLGSCLMWNYAAVCGGRILLKNCQCLV